MVERGLSGYRLAELIGAKQSAVAQWLTRGRIPFAPTLSRLCAHLGVRPEWLVDGTGPKHAPKIKDAMDALPADIKADLAALGEAATRSKDVRGVVGHLARAFRQ